MVIWFSRPISQLKSLASLGVFHTFRRHAQVDTTLRTIHGYLWLPWGKSVLIKWRQCIKQFTSKSLATNLVTKKIRTLGMCINLNKLSLCHFYTLEVAFSQASKSIVHGFICRDLVGNESQSFITLKQQQYLNHRNLVKNWKAKELWSAGKWKAILYHLAAMAGLQVSLLDICDARSWNSCCCWS